MKMTDEILKELWETKDNIAKEHGYSVDALAEYYLKKQTARHGRFSQDVSEKSRTRRSIQTISSSRR
jgi:hypothetical protein